MDANMKKRNELLAKTVIKGLESRNMSGYYAQDKEEMCIRDSPYMEQFCINIMDGDIRA